MPDTETDLSYKDYFDNPLRKAQEWLKQAEHSYMGIKPRIQRNRDHMALKSKHIEVRKSAEEFRSAKYIPMLNPAIQANTDVMMDIVRGGDPLVKAEANVPEDEEAMVKQIQDDNANLIERYMNRCLQPECGDIMYVFDEFFNAGGVDPYTLMFVEPSFKEIDATEWEEVPVMIGGIEVDTEYNRIKVPNQLYLPYPQFIVVAPEDARIDMHPRNWRNWRYIFRIKDITADDMKYNAEINEYWNKENVDKILEQNDFSVKSVTERVDYGTVSPDIALDAEGNYRQIIGRIRVWNPDIRRLEIREISWIEGAEDDHATLYEKPYEYSNYGSSHIVTSNFPLPNEPIGMSTADMGAALQDYGNEGYNQAWEAGERSIDPPVAIADVFQTRTSWRPRAKWILEKGAQMAPRDAVHQLHPVGGQSPMVLMTSMAEQRLSLVTKMLDVVTGASFSGERKKETLGKEQMRHEAASKGIARMIGRHIDRFELLLNHSWEMMKEELWKAYRNGALKYAAPEVRALFGMDEDDKMTRPDILDTDVRLSMPHVKTYVSKEDNFQKILGLYHILVLEDPIFAQTHPHGVEEIRRRVLEAADMKNVKLILDVDGNIEEQLPFNMPQQLQEAA